MFGPYLCRASVVLTNMHLWWRISDGSGGRPSLLQALLSHMFSV